MTIEIHPLAELFPLISGPEFDELVSSIKEHGQRDAIVLYHGQILDGRNRYRACGVAGVEPRFETYQGNDPTAFVIDKNVHRRHLNESQRAMIAARLANLGNKQKASNFKPMPEVEISTSHPITMDRAAEMLNVERSTVAFAKNVLKDGTQDEINAVRDGRASVTGIGRQIRAGIPAEERELDTKNSRASKEGKKRGAKRLQLNAMMWGRLRDGLNNLSDLPRPADAVPIARHMDRVGLVDSKLFSTIQWLKEFAHEWSKRDETTIADDTANG